ncbi:hypothetical protein NEPAR04_1557 [Nematocida parisii]|nr:hypothetical protein NEPAR03_1825 [Nematocida parisii]KAI5129985.1 hypothetical protein NEPAR08_1804 [Nematocida parisii]KAI5142634.1 hypothetical protein NEPAR04_1557 [Nematocida parisii]
MDSIEGNALLKKVNALITRLDQEEMIKYFKLDGYIRVNTYFISPFSLITIKRGLKNFLVSWEMTENGWKFVFNNNACVNFKGPLTSQTKDGKIIHIKIDCAKIECNSEMHYAVLTRYFKCLDTFYFMVTEVDEEFELLTNPLGSVCGWSQLKK